MTQQLLKLIDEFFRSDEFYVTGVFGHKYHGNTEYSRLEVGHLLEFVPDKTIESLIPWASQSMNSEHSFNAFLKKMAQQGNMAFAPCVHFYDRGTPVLVLKYNRYLHVMKGSYFQVSYTGRGHGTYQSSNTHFDIVLRSCSRAFEDYADEKDLSFKDVSANMLEVQQMLFYMTVISAATGIDQFHDLLNSDPVVVNEFVSACWGNRELSDYRVSYQDLIGLVEIAETPIDADSNNVYRVKKSETMDYCRIMTDKDTFIQVDVPSESGILSRKMELPPCEITKEMFLTYLGFMLNVSGFVCNSMVTYPIDASVATFKALNNPEIGEFKNICSIK